MNRSQQKILAMAGCYLTDLALIAWLYFRATNYSRYTGTLEGKIDSPDFQIQLYKVVLQSLTFALLLFLAAQTVVYILAWRKFRGAYLYLKFFSVFGFVAAFFIAVTSSAYAMLPMLIYIGGYYVFSKLFKESSAIMQTSPQSSIQQ
jgi:hypothetical protein